MPKLEFVGQSTQDQDDPTARTSRLVNCYREPSGGRSAYLLKPVLGMRDFASTGAVFVRATHVMAGILYALAGGKLFRVNSDGTSDELATVVDSDESSMDSNNGVLTIVAGGRYWTWNGVTLNEPAAGAFSDIGSVGFIAQRTILTERSGRRFAWSEVADPDTIDGLSFATTESRDDNNLRVMPFGGTLWFFKERSIEPWYPTGADDVFAPVSGGALDIGLKGYGLIARTPRALAFVGSDNKVHLLSGGVQPISTVAVESAIKLSEPTHCFYYQDKGHEFVVVRFADRPAFAHDLSTGEWHERAEGLDLGPWTATGCESAYGKFIVSNVLGEFAELVPAALDGSIPLICEAQSRTLRMENDRFRISEFEIFGRVGVNDLNAPEILQIDGLEVLDAGDGGALIIGEGDGRTEAKIELFLSRDSGMTWGAPKPRGLGIRGEYNTRMNWRALGQFRAATARLRWSDTAGISIDAEGVVKFG